MDGGPPHTFDTTLKRVLEERVKLNGGRLDRMIVSHVDNDHIVGCIDLLAELRSERDNGLPELVSVQGLWHNSFASSLDPDNILGPRLQSLLGVTGMDTVMNYSAASILGIGEGDTLRRFARILEIPINADVPDPIIVESASSPVGLGNLSLTIVGPTLENLEDLRNEWVEWLEEHEDNIASGDPRLMANADKSVPNLSSICLVAESDGRNNFVDG